jgi:hypothetical protein
MKSTGWEQTMNNKIPSGRVSLTALAGAPYQFHYLRKRCGGGNGEKNVNKL